MNDKFDAQLSTATNQRIEWVDVFKGIAILLIVFGHFSIGQTAKNFIYSFHVPLFVFASGLVSKKRSNYAEFLLKDIVKSIKPYVVFTVIWMLFELSWNTFVLKDTVFYPFYKYILTIFLGNGNLTGISIGVQWYLSMYIMIRLIYSLIDFIKYKNLKLLFAAMSFVVGAFLLNNNAVFPWCLSSALTGVLFFCIGDVFKDQIYNFAHKYQSFRFYRIIIPVICFTVVFLIRGENSMSKNYYYFPPLFLVSALLGFIGTVAISTDLLNLNIFKINKILLFLGINSLYVMCWHSELRVILIHYLGLCINNSIIKNLIALILSLVVCFPLSLLSDKVLSPNWFLSKRH